LIGKAKKREALGYSRGRWKMEDGRGKMEATDRRTEIRDRRTEDSDQRPVEGRWSNGIETFYALAPSRLAPCGREMEDGSNYEEVMPGLGMME
jgi:hypothetical protein